MSESTAVTPVFRVVFPNFFTPKPVMKNGKPVGDPLYGCEMLFDADNLGPEDAERFKNLKATAVRVVKEKWPGRDLKEVRFPFRDGDKEAERLAKLGKNGDFYRGMVALKSNSKFAPQVVDIDRQEIIDEKRVYSGCYCYAEVNFVAYDGVNGGQDGVKAYLNMVMKAKDGERLMGRSASDVFAGVAGGESNEDPTAADDDIPF